MDRVKEEIVQNILKHLIISRRNTEVILHFLEHYQEEDKEENMEILGGTGGRPWEPDTLKLTTSVAK